MRKANSAVTPEGYPVIFLTTVCAIVFALLGCTLLAVLSLVAVWFALHFFRDPERVVPTDPDCAVSPADGKIVRIEEKEDPMSGETRVCVSIFMNLFNVHVNRMPVAGTIRHITYWPGKYFNASLDKASKYNERCGFLAEAANGSTWSFVQIAGLVARRIVCRTEEGDTLARGERFGMIRFGSRVDLYLPSGYIPVTALGDTVLAGQTIVARKKN